jgi:Fe-S-cluster containining protein
MKCKGCGKCCTVRHPFLELDIFPDYEHKFKKELEWGTLKRKNGSWTVRRRKDKSCIFLEPANNTCTIYKDRPIECRRFKQGHPVCQIVCKEKKCLETKG